MQAVSSRFFLLDPDAAACEKTLCVLNGKSLLPSNQNLQPASLGSNQETLINKRTDSEKYSFLKESPLATKSNPGSADTQRGYCQSKTAITSFDLSSAQRLFPDFYPRGKLFRYDHDRAIPLDVQADPVLGSWMHLFGLQTIK